jgi:hypothetical protein
VEAPSLDEQMGNPSAKKQNIPCLGTDIGHQNDPAQRYQRLGRYTQTEWVRDNRPKYWTSATRSRVVARSCASFTIATSMTRHRQEAETPCANGWYFARGKALITVAPSSANGGSLPRQWIALQTSHDLREAGAIGCNVYILHGSRS